MPQRLCYAGKSCPSHPNMSLCGPIVQPVAISVPPKGNQYFRHGSDDMALGDGATPAFHLEPAACDALLYVAIAREGCDKPMASTTIRHT